MMINLINNKEFIVYKVMVMLYKIIKVKNLGDIYKVLALLKVTKLLAN